MLVRTLWVHSSLQCVYNLVTRLLQGCHKVVTRLSQPCHNLVTTLSTTLSTTLLHTTLLQPSYKVVTISNPRFSQPCDKVVTTIWYNLVTTLSQPCHNLVISVWELLSDAGKIQVQFIVAMDFTYIHRHFILALYSALGETRHDFAIGHA